MELNNARDDLFLVFFAAVPHFLLLPRVCRARFPVFGTPNPDSLALRIGRDMAALTAKLRMAIRYSLAQSLVEYFLSPEKPPPELQALLDRLNEIRLPSPRRYEGDTELGRRADVVLVVTILVIIGVASLALFR